MYNYLYIGYAGVWDESTTSVTILADDWRDALSKIYEYVSGTIKPELFKKSLIGCNVEGAIDLIEAISNENVLYFGLAYEPLYNKLNKI